MSKTLHNRDTQGMQNSRKLVPPIYDISCCLFKGLLRRKATPAKTISAESIQ